MKRKLKAYTLTILVALGLVAGMYHFTLNDESKQEQNCFAVADSPASQRLRQVLDSITDEGMNRVEKIKAVHDWMVKNIEYDVTYKQHSAEETLFNGIAVCTGYADLFYQFMHALKIPCIPLVGYVYKDLSVKHAWNAVLLEDGNWYYVDVCWDDPLRTTDPSGIVETSDFPDGRNLSYKYFLVGSKTMNKERKPDLLPEGNISKADLNWKKMITQKKEVKKYEEK